MVDTAVVVLFSILTLLPIFFTLYFYKRAAVFVFFLCMTLLAGAGFYFSSGASGQPIFEVYLILSLIGTSISMVMLILELLRDTLGGIKGRA